jgi:DNA-binding response OmpR family regulator
MLPPGKSRLDMTFPQGEAAGSILVIDDDESICDVVAQMLTDEGYVVRCVGTAGGALHAVQEQPPGLILLDLSLPDQRGEAFITAYRQSLNGTAPIIVFSARTDAEQLAAQLGANGTLPKPFDLLELLRTVQAALSAGDESKS